MQVAPEIASYMHCACEPVTVHGYTRVFMIVPHLRSMHTVVSCIVKTTSCNTTPQAEGATLKRRVINANCVECAHQHRERPQKHAQRCIWKQLALSSGHTNLGGKHTKKNFSKHYLDSVCCTIFSFTFMQHASPCCPSFQLHNAPLTTVRIG